MPGSCAIHCLVPFLLLQAGGTPGDEPAALVRFRQHVLLGDLAAARDLLPEAGAAVDLASRVLLEAATLDAGARAEAMLQICRIYARTPAADTALVAGLAALLDLQDRDWLLADSGLPGRDGPAYDDDRDTVDVVRVAELLAGFQDALETQRQWRGAEEALQDAEWILATAAVARVDRPVRIAAGAFIPVPAPLAEDIEVRFLPWPDDGRCVLEVYRDARGPGSPPRRLAAAVFGQQVEAPPPGEYLLEQRSLASGSTTLRRLLVSDLSLTVEAWEDGIAVLASLGGTPAASANVSIGVDSSGACERRFELSTDEMGLAVVRIPADLRARSMRFDVIADAGGHCARVHDLCLQASEHESSWIEAHVMVDRPLYRPGDTVQGRVVLRRHDLKDDRIHSLPLACAPARLTFWEGSPAEETIEARSDASGVIPFTLPLGQATPLGNASLTLSLTDSNPSSPSADGRKDLDVGTWTPFAVREFRRPFLLVEASGPELARRGEPALVAVRARYPAGPPAAGLAGRIIASVGPLQEQRAFLLDGSGTARAPLHLHELPLPPGEQQVSVRFEVVAPDGQILADSCSFRLEAEEQVAAADDGLQLTLITEEPRAGRPVRIRLAGGLPGRPVLVTHGRLGLLGAARVLLDERGRGEVIIETLPEHWPGIVVRAIQEIPEVLERWRPYWYGTSLSVALSPPAGPLLVELDARARYAPGERAELKLRVSDEQGRGVKATTTVAVVDETVFELEADRTAHPTLSLTPPIDASAALAAHSLGCPSPWLTLGELLRDGAIAPWAVEWYSGAGSGWANPAKAPAAIGALTVGRDFRATALFAASLETDEDGRGSVSFTFPDDLTRWRITVAAIDCGVRGCLRTFATETTLPLSATPILPRLLRQGDELDVSVLLNRQDGTAGPCEVAMRAEGGARVEGVERATVLVAPEEAARTTFRLRAVEARAATTISEVADGSTAHAAVHTLPVLPDLTVRPVSSAVLVERRAELCLPDDLPGPVARRTLELLSGREALLRRAAEYLQGYPHGCVEQVLSRMAPLFAAARARRVSGQGREASLSREQGLALEAGMAHLRGLLADRSTGFRWWPAGPVDERMTALALTALSHARESGIDGTRYGIEVTPDAGELAALAMHAEACGSQVGDREDEVSLDQAELLVACLRYGANLPYFAHAVRALVEEQQALPAGLLARAGLALHCSGSEALAAAVLERILAARDLLQPDWPRGAIPVGEAEAERVAQLLELALTVSPDHPARPRLMERLLRLHGGNSVSTFAAAAAIHTLALDAEFHGGGRESGAVRATIEDDSRTLAVTLDETNGYRVKLPVSAAGRLAVAVDGKQPVVAVLQGEAEAQGSTHVGWRSPLQVERRLLRVETDASGSEHLTDLADADPVHLGDLLEARIEVRCDEPVAYVVVSCPLPAGFEVAGGSGWELRDDQPGRAAPPAGAYRRGGVAAGRGRGDVRAGPLRRVTRRPARRDGAAPSRGRCVALPAAQRGTPAGADRRAALDAPPHERVIPGVQHDPRAARAVRQRRAPRPPRRGRARRDALARPSGSAGSLRRGDARAARGAGEEKGLRKQGRGPGQERPGPLRRQGLAPGVRRGTQSCAAPLTGRAGRQRA
ncbi:MAG: hypothetical protein HY812_03965 [Planctomycetes bacterium]|nr:hypothetical protein [Planctomycetota bacterium]